MTRVIVNGTFDVLHLGHLGLLKYAQNLGWYVLVLIDSDRRVRELKGIDRPVNTQEERAEMLPEHDRQCWKNETWQSSLSRSSHRP